MYREHWNLNILPFENVPNPTFFFSGPTHEEALHRLSYAVFQGKGGAMIVGEVGCGKTMLGRVLINHLTDSGYRVATMTNPALAPLDFVRMVMDLFEVDCNRGNSKARMWQALEKKLRNNLRAGAGSALLIDEAQVIDNSKTLDELRMLLNLQSDDRFLLNVILLGQPQLEARVRSSSPLLQRISVRYHLQPLSAADTTSYIKHRLKAAGFERTPFTREAVRAIVDFSSGIPREINKLCDRSLLATYLANRKLATRAIVEEAWEDLN